MTTPHPLPIDAILPELLRTLAASRNLVLHAPPGAGKTTRVPLALLDLIPPASGRIVMLEPRRIAAVSAARWMARCLGEEVGQTVGYSIRFDSRVSAATRIEVVTEGILTRRIQHDPLLDGVGLVIFDEFHERSIQADLGLALCRDVQRQVREDLKILVMSATLECEPLARLLDGAPILSSPGRAFPVREEFSDDHHGSLTDRMCAAIHRAIVETEGDILAFLPGTGEIRACAAVCAASGIAGKGITVHQLFGDLPFEQQQAAIQPGTCRKVILATSIAETSLTIEGVRVVIDSGLSRRLRSDPASGMNRLVTVRASKASALQRDGRAGRLGPGVCYRLYSRHSFNAMTPYTPPEVMEADLAPLMLELAAWGVRDATALDWLDVPPEAGCNAARSLLSGLGALDDCGRITPLGTDMAGYPVHPRLARLLKSAEQLGCHRLGCDLAALVAERDIFRTGRGTQEARRGESDLTERLECLHAWRARRGGTDRHADANLLAAVDRTARQLERIMKVRREGNAVTDDNLVARLLLAAYPDRIARLRDAGERSYLLASGRGACLSPRSVVRDAPFIVAVDGDSGSGSEGVIHLAASVPEQLLRAECGSLIRSEQRIVWNEREGRVEAETVERLGAITLGRAPLTAADGDVVPAVLAAVRDSRLRLLRLDEPVRQLQGRVALLRQVMPEQGWPDLSDEALAATLEQWLESRLGGVRTARALAAIDVAEALRATMEYRRLRELDELAPTHLTVPSGSRIRLDYAQGEVPVLAVKLQELFGLGETPRLAGGRADVLLHLLSPAGRPLQVTRDLRGFWNSAYHEVKKEMKGRYPKHPWPDDPWNAMPTKRTKNKMTSR